MSQNTSLSPHSTPERMMYPIASTKLSEVLKATSVGERVNVHVVESVPEPRPDFDAMQRVIESSDQFIEPDLKRERKD